MYIHIIIYIYITVYTHIYASDYMGYLYLIERKHQELVLVKLNMSYTHL